MKDKYKDRKFHSKIITYLIVRFLFAKLIYVNFFRKIYLILYSVPCDNYYLLLIVVAKVINFEYF